MSALRRWILALLVAGMLAACGGHPSASVSSTPGMTPSAAAPATDVPALPAATDTPLPPRLLLFAPDELPSPYGAVLPRVDALAEAQGWQVERRASLPAEAAPLAPEVRAVVVLPGAGDPLPLARSNPALPFLGVDLPSQAALPAALNVLDFSGVSPEKRAFLAGYIAALSTEDWRIGVVSEDPALAEAFRQGAVYFCGLCRPAYPPFHRYPAEAQVPPGSSADVWYSAFEALAEQSVETLYLPAPLPGEDVPAALLPDVDFRLLLDASPPEALSERWAALIRPDVASAFDAAWSALLAGEGGQRFAVSLKVEVSDDGRLSPGRLRLVEQMAESLREGLVGPR